MKKYIIITVCMIVAITSSLLIVRYIDNSSRTMTYAEARKISYGLQKLREDEKKQEFQASKDRLMRMVNEFNKNHNPQ